MSVTNDKVKEQFKKCEGIHKSIDQQTNTLAALVLTTPKEQSTAPKSVQPSRIALQQVEEDNSDDVVYTNHFPCSFARDLTFYQYDVIVEEYHKKQNKYINISSREKRRQFVSDILLGKTIHPTAVCWYDEGSCMYSTTNLKDKLPIIYEKEEQGYQRRLTIKSLSATSGTNDLDQSSIRIIETLIKQVLKEQFKAIGSVFYRWDEEPDQDGPYDLLTGFKQAMCLTESGPTLNVDITITRFYPHLDLLTYIWERLLQNKSPFHGWLSDRQYDQIGNRLKDAEVTTIQSDHQNKYVLTGYFSDNLPENTFIERQGNLLDYYKHLGFELRYPKLYCLKAYRLGNPQNIVDLPIELCCLEEWQQVKEDENTKPIPAPSVSLATQCANFTKVQRISNLRSYCDKLLKSVNTKLSGENKQIAQLQTPIKTMFIGADVQHPKNNYSGELPSIAAVVASMNSECTLTNQRVSRQWPINEIQYSLSELEELTYSLCHTDQRIDNRLSESIPSVLHLADAAASTARQLFDSSTRPPNAIQAEILRVHEDMQDTPHMF
ncbi:unnamed protein product [Rotaria sordida]|uniref:Uncharacterized protein n=1 Tax=Rotaria sordida TaxID=392033 RepID=A0A815EU03_9BILA|nr:unnamed protein product [Rotaria sordida]CAF3809120.1 unnamed protein product [Rotaria sordida]